MMAAAPKRIAAPQKGANSASVDFTAKALIPVKSTIIAKATKTGLLGILGSTTSPVTPYLLFASSNPLLYSETPD